MVYQVTIINQLFKELKPKHNNTIDDCLIVTIINQLFKELKPSASGAFSKYS